MPHLVDRIEEELRQAVCSRSYNQLAELAILYRKAVEGWASSLEPGDPRIVERAARSAEVLQGALARLQCDREELASQLGQLPKLKSFLETAPERCSRVRFDG